MMITTVRSWEVADLHLSATRQIWKTTSIQSWRMTSRRRDREVSRSIWTSTTARWRVKKTLGPIGKHTALWLTTGTVTSSISLAIRGFSLTTNQANRIKPPRSRSATWQVTTPAERASTCRANTSAATFSFNQKATSPTWMKANNKTTRVESSTSKFLRWIESAPLIEDSRGPSTPSYRRWETTIKWMGSVLMTKSTTLGRTWAGSRCQARRTRARSTCN